MNRALWCALSCYDAAHVERAARGHGRAELTALERSQAHAITTLREEVAALKHQLEWFRRQIFGQKSERFVPEPDPRSCI